MRLTSSVPVDPASRFTMAEKDKKLVIIGDGAVGKTCLLEVIENDKFLDKPYRPTVFHNTEKKIDNPNNPGEELRMHL